MRMKVIFTIGYKNYNKPLFSTTKELDKPFYEVLQGYCDYFRTFSWNEKYKLFLKVTDLFIKTNYVIFEDFKEVIFIVISNAPLF